MPGTSPKALDPLKDLLGEVLGRLEALEAKVGVKAPVSSSVAPSSAAPVAPKPSPASLQAAGEVPAVKAYDAYMKSAVIPFAASCEDINLNEVGKLCVSAWEGLRIIIVLASRSKIPTEDLATALQPHLSTTQDSIKQLHALKLDRDFDRHMKAIFELVPCLSWVLYKAPQRLPAGMVKEALASAEFWTNRIRKDYKDKDSKQVAFCDNVKKVIIELVDYIETYHKTGLSFNPKGVSLAEAAIRLSDEPVVAQDETPKSPIPKRHPSLGGALIGGNVAGLMDELNKRKSADGSSAATGLKHVTKDQQTWRKEYKKDEKAPAGGPPATPSMDVSQTGTKKKEKKKLDGLPIFEYQDRGFKWVVENQTKESVQKEFPDSGVLTVEISDPKQQVYMYNCEGITVKVKGKFKALVLDKCVQCAVVYDTLISSAEIVNCKKIQLQVDGVCPVFTIDKTVNILIWLSKESLDVSAFTTSLSSEMNVSFPDGDDQKEVPIPEQFVHKISSGSVSSEVSDLYH